MGRALCCELQNKEYTIRGVARQAIRTGYSADVRGNDLGVEECIAVGDIGPQTDWGRALVDVDTVVHLASRAHVMREVADDPEDEYRRVNVAGTERLAAMAADAGVRRFIYLSSVKVNGERTVAAPFTESDVPYPEDVYGRFKLETEDRLRRVAGFSKLEVVIIRPPLVYGPGVKANFLRLMEWIWRGVPLPLKKVSNRRSLIYVGNLVDAIIACVEHPAATGKTFLVSDNEDVSTPELIRRMAHALGRPARLFPCPPALLHAGARLTGRQEAAERLLGSLVVDSSKIRRELGWKPPYTMEQGLAETARWYKATHGV